MSWWNPTVPQSPPLRSRINPNGNRYGPNIWDRIAAMAAAAPAPRQAPPVPGWPVAQPAPSGILRPGVTPWSGPAPVSLAPQRPQQARGRPQTRGPAAPRQSTPATPPGMSANDVIAAMGAGLQAPFQALADYTYSPQRSNEPRISHLSRQILTAPLRASGAAGQQIVNGAQAAGGAVADAFRYLTATPNSDLERAFNAMIGQESGGQQFDRSGRPLTSPAGAIGIAQVMPGTGPEAARLAGLPWDENRYKNDSAYNRALGFAYFREQVRQNNGDVVKAMAAYNAGPGRVQQAEQRAAATGQPWTAFLPPETQNYIPSVLSRMGSLAEGFGAAAPAFNAAPYQAAMAAQDQASTLLSQPYSTEFQETPLPERPAPTELTAPDYSAGDAAFEQTRPQNPFDDPKERVRVQRQQFFKGIGQAMAGLSGGEGIGTILFKMGAGALVGRARGDELVDSKEEEFEARMAEFNRALANRNDQKAAQAANILNSNIQQRNQYADQLWADSVAKIKAKQPQVVNDRLITYTEDAENPGKFTMTVTPLGFGIQAEALLNKANIGIQMGQAQAESARFAYSSQQTTARTALGLSMQVAAQQGNPQAVAEGMQTGAAMRIRSTVQTGTWKGMFNDKQTAGEIEQTATQRAYQALGVMLRPNGQPAIPLEGTALSQFREVYEDQLTAQLYEFAARNGTLANMFVNPTATSAFDVQRSANTRQSTRTDWRGRQSTSTSWDLSE